jgi:hypothetical protein
MRRSWRSNRAELRGVDVYKIDVDVTAVEVVALLGGATLSSSASAVTTRLPETAAQQPGGGS